MRAGAIGLLPSVPRMRDCPVPPPQSLLNTKILFPTRPTLAALSGDYGAIGSSPS